MECNQQSCPKEHDAQRSPPKIKTQYKQGLLDVSKDKTNKMLNNGLEAELGSKTKGNNACRQYIRI
jgi:hypothetical protein